MSDDMPALLLVLFTENERDIFSALALLALGNPFLPLRIELITALVGGMLPPIRDRYKAGRRDARW